MDLLKKWGRNLADANIKIPVSVIATILGLASLGNLYRMLGFEVFWPTAGVLGIIIVLYTLIKYIRYPRVMAEEFKNPAIVGLFPCPAMIMMIIGAFLRPYFPAFAKGLWLFSFAFFAIILVLFLYIHMFKYRDKNKFNPGFLVPFCSYIVGTVVGTGMDEPEFCRALIALSFFTFLVVLPYTFYRLLKKPPEGYAKLSKFIIVAPFGLLGASALNFYPDLSPAAVAAFFIATLVVYIYIFGTTIPAVITKPFVAGHAAMTFPSAIASVFTYRYFVYLSGQDSYWAGLVRNIAGVQLFISTAIIAYVLVNYIRVLWGVLNEERGKADNAA